MHKDLLLKRALPEGDVDIPDVGKVRVRGLSRAESLLVAKVEGWAAKEQRMLAMAMLDPAMTEEEVKQWQEAATSEELDMVSGKVAELSGMLDGAAKEAYKSLRGADGPGVRVLPGAEAGDDRGDAQGPYL